MAKALSTTAEVPDVLGVTAARVRQMVLRGELEAEKFGRDLMISVDAVANAKKRKTSPGPSPTSKAKAAKATKS